ncbi:RNA-directed DNA polymerase, eukaryota, nucleotide-binding alpha-beta plait domain protein [Tanacetum coccineum]
MQPPAIHNRVDPPSRSKNYRHLSIRSNEDRVRSISRSIFVTNFPDSTTAKDLWKICQGYGSVVDVFIPNRKSKAGKRFAFVRFIRVGNIERLVDNISTLWIGRMHLQANVVRFERPPINTARPSFPSKPFNNGSSSFASVLKGNNLPHVISPSPAMVLDESCIVSRDLDLFVMGEAKNILSIPNLYILLSNEGFHNVKLSYLGGLWVMIELESINSKEKFMQHSGVASWFSNLCNAQLDFVSRNRIVWVDIEGVPSYYYGGDTLASMDMILMDQEGSRISATMVANHPFKINFYKKTQVKAIQSVFPCKHGFSFVPFTEFVEDNVKEEQVVDVIGLIAAVGDVIQGERKGKNNRRMVVELTDIEGLKLKCTLWDAWIVDFNTRMESSSDHIKVSVESISVSNTFYSSRFFINEEIPEIADFKSRLLARVGDDTSSLQVSNLTSESAEAFQEKSFFYGTKYVNLDQLMDVIEPYACVALASITSIEYEEGWVYTACCKCNCKAVPNDDESSSKKAGKRKIRNTYRCETCGPDIVDVIPKFRIEFRVDVSRYNLINNYAVYTVGRMTSNEVKDVNEDGYETDGDKEEPIIETNQNQKPDTSTPSKDVESSIAENMVKVEPVEFNATPPQGKRVIADVDKDKGAPSVTSRNKKKAVFSRRDK